MDYEELFEQGFTSGKPASACPYQTKLAAWSWMDGVQAEADAARTATLAEQCIVYAVLDPRMDLYRAFYRYPGEAELAAAQIEGGSVAHVLLNAVLLEPDLNEPVLYADGNRPVAHPATYSEREP